MKANTPLEQIFLNTKDIKKLNEQIAPVYKSNVNLGALANVVDVADTNLTTDIEKAFIMDFNGNLYKFIAFNEDKTKAYIEYYANLKGATGADGAPGQDGQDGARGYSIHYANVDFDEAITTYNLSDISQNTPIIANDVILFKNGYLVLIYDVETTTCETANGTAVKLENNVIPTITIEAGQIIDQTHFNLTPEQSALLETHPSYINLIMNGANYPLTLAYSTGNNQHYVNIAYIDTPASIMTLEFNFDTLYNNCVVTQDSFTKSKQLYQHNIAIKDTTPIRCYLTIINDNNTPFTSKMLYDFLIDNNMTNDTKSYEATGVYQTNVIHSLCAYNNQIYFNWGTAGNDKSYSSLTNAITDTVISI